MATPGPLGGPLRPGPSAALWSGPVTTSVLLGLWWWTAERPAPAAVLAGGSGAASSGRVAVEAPPAGVGRPRSDTAGSAAPIPLPGQPATRRRPPAPQRWPAPLWPSSPALPLQRSSHHPPTAAARRWLPGILAVASWLCLLGTALRRRRGRRSPLPLAMASVTGPAQSDQPPDPAEGASNQSPDEFGQSVPLLLPRTVYQIKVTLDGAPDPIWRRLLVDPAMELKDLHQVLQITMPWGDRRLHHFVSQGEDVYYVPPITDPTRQRWVGPSDQFYDGVQLKDLLQAEADHISYEYDFLDHWCHELLLEKIHLSAADLPLPRCVAGERACPPEGSRNPLGDPADSPCWALARQLNFSHEAVDKYLILWGQGKPSSTVESAL